MKNLKISKKIICTFAVVLLLTFALGVVSEVRRLGYDRQHGQQQLHRRYMVQLSHDRRGFPEQGAHTLERCPRHDGERSARHHRRLQADGDTLC